MAEARAGSPEGLGQQVLETWRSHHGIRWLGYPISHGRGAPRWFVAAAVLWAPRPSIVPAPLLAQSSGGDEVRESLGRHFERYEVAGTFVLHDIERDRRVRYDPERAATRFIPASTFKVFNSLVALETGVVDGPETAFAWDGVDRGSSGWNRDQTLRTAFQRSAVWVYQEVARRIGEDRMRAYVRREGYGNGDIDGGIDRFWLDGDLRISADEQVDLLRRLYREELGFSSRTMRIVKEIMILERTPTYTVRGKTGWAGPQEEGGPQVGWLVGWVERGEEAYFFAMNLDATRPGFPMREAREEITFGILEELGVLPEGHGVGSRP